MSQSVIDSDETGSPVRANADGILVSSLKVEVRFSADVPLGSGR